MDHAEELQRKCVKHVRKPLSKALLQEIKAAEAQKAEQDVKNEEEGDKEKEKDHAHHNMDIFGIFHRKSESHSIRVNSPLTSG